MIEYVTRFLNMIVAGLLAHAARLTKVAAVRHEVAEYTAVLEEADLLEHSTVPAKRQLAKLLRLEVERTIETAFTEAPAPPPPALNGDGHHPFALPRRGHRREPSGRGGESTAPPSGPPFVEGERGETDGGRRANAAAGAGGGAGRPDSIDQSHTGSSPLTRSDASMGRKRLLTSDHERDGPPGLERFPHLGAEHSEFLEHTRHAAPERPGRPGG